MPRDLSDRDREILKRLAPECGEEICSGSGHAFLSILPPVANHFSRDGADFSGRIGRLSDEELGYLAGLILEGKESLGCVPTDFIEIFLSRVAERLGNRRAEEIVLHMVEEGECDIPGEGPPAER
ncbi:MAG TPA: hypothetical protein VMS81_05620 [Methanomicrobiales archaeon]|jgi:hypothetical protein|nr:hypothetical protein [Methanomicrobiales archaeon]